mgnify:CR=1 FL=1
MTVQEESATGTATHGVILTDAAAAKAKALLDQEGRDDLALRIAVQPGGCAGLRYNLFFDDRALDGDLTAEQWAVAGELPIDRVPVAKTLPGLAADAVKFAPEPTVMPTAARTTASAARVRRGCAARACRRVTGDPSRGLGMCGTKPIACGSDLLRRGVPSALSAQWTDGLRIWRVHARERP